MADVLAATCSFQHVGDAMLLACTASQYRQLLTHIMYNMADLCKRILQIKHKIAKPEGKKGVQDSHREGMLSVMEVLKAELLCEGNLPSGIVVYTDEAELKALFSPAHANIGGDDQVATE